MQLSPGNCTPVPPSSGEGKLQEEGVPTASTAGSPALGCLSGKQVCGKTVFRTPGTPQIWEEHTRSLVWPKPSSPSLPPMLSSWTSPPQFLQIPVPLQGSSTLLSYTYCQLSSGKKHLIYLFPPTGGGLCVRDGARSRAVLSKQAS